MDGLTDRPRLFHSPFDRLRANGKTLNLMAVEGRVEGTRELVLTGTQYILPYRVQGLQNQVLAVFHGRREWPDQF